VVERSVLQMRLVVEAADYEQAVAFYRDVLGARVLDVTRFPGSDAVAHAELDFGLGKMTLSDPMKDYGLVAPDPSPETYAVLRFTDLGPGIARQNLPRLSERFYRVDGQKSGARSGTGLGLAIVKHIMNRHRGGLVVASAEGEGSTFTAYFPMAGAPDAVVKAS